jgi:2-polyprenyl-3-methyl-5-hydroxy-6-metoxy-1,4-benzoquinol methylase
MSEDPRTAWNDGADAWNEFVESGADYHRWEIHGPGLLDACGDIDGLRVLDLGCGQGFFSRQLAQRGARVIGVDLSEKQVEHARAHEARWGHGIEYHALDAARVAQRWPAESFELVTSCMALQDMADAEAVLCAARTLLAPAGRLVFSVPNPGTDTPFREWGRDEQGSKLALHIDRYFESGPRVCHWNMPRLTAHWQTPSWHRTLSEWSALLAQAGFLIRRIHEPRPTRAQVERRPELEAGYRLPFYLVFDAVGGRVAPGPIH